MDAINVAITQAGKGGPATDIDLDLDLDSDSLVAPALPQPTWPRDTDLVYVAGTTKVILSNQGPLLHGIIQCAIDNIRASLLFEHSFPDITVVGAIVTKAVFDATRQYIAPGG